MSLFAEVVSNDRPLVARYEGKWYFPFVSNPPETTLRRRLHSRRPIGRDPFIREQFAKPGNFALPTLNA